METLTALKFNTARGAEDALDVVKDLSKDQLIKLEDAAIISWPVGNNKPSTKHLAEMALTGAGALNGAFWGLLFGIVFYVPIAGLAAGTAIGALTGALVKVGIDNDFINSVRSKVTEGTSALFLLTSDAVVDRVVDATKQFDFEIIATNLSKEEEMKLREAFAEEKTDWAR
jgi:uncharacterized membrane protein